MSHTEYSVDEFFVKKVRNINQSQAVRANFQTRESAEASEKPVVPVMDVDERLNMVHS